MEIEMLKNNPIFQNIVNTQISPDNTIRDDQYQIIQITCDITGEICEDCGCCSCCKIAEGEISRGIYNDILGLFPVHEFTRNGVIGKRNCNNSFYEFESVDSLKKSLDNSGWLSKLEKYPKLPDGVQEQYHILNECIEVLTNLYEITEYMYLAEYPLIVICRDRVFVEAPYY